MRHQIGTAVHAIIIGVVLCFPYGSIVDTAAAETSLNKSSGDTNGSERRAKSARKGHGQSPANKRTSQEVPEHARISVGKRQGQSPANKPTSSDRQEHSATSVDKGEGQSPGPQ